MACGHSKSAPIIKTKFGTPVIIIFGLSGGGICFLGGLHPSTLEPDASVGCRSDCFFNCLSLVPFPDAFFQLPL